MTASAPYGTWRSPISAASIAQGAVRLADPWPADDGVYWIELRPAEEGRNELVAVPAAGDAEPSVLASGHDFYSFPRISPDGKRLAWTCWDHPRMPWDGTELWVGELTADGVLGEPERVAGDEGESVFQPEWSPDGVLHFVSDRTGWWNLYRRGAGGDEALAPTEAEFGVPQWVFGRATYAFLPDGQVACTYLREGTPKLALLDPGSGTLEDVETSHVPVGLPSL